MNTVREFIDDPVIRFLALGIAAFIVFAKLMEHWPHRCPSCGREFDTFQERDSHIVKVHIAE